MMTALLLYGYAVGVFSSRRIERACFEDVAFRVLAAGEQPHFTTINEFRATHRASFADLFQQVLKVCMSAGLVKLGHVAIDGTKLKANASKHKAMSYGRMNEAEARLKAEVAAWFAKAAASDAAEDAAHGADRRGDEMPAWVANKQERAAKIRAARAALEAEAQAAATKRTAPADG